MIKTDISGHVNDTHLKTSSSLALDSSIKETEELHKQIKKAKDKGEDITGIELKNSVKQIGKLDNIAELESRILYQKRKQTSELSLKSRVGVAAKKSNSSELAKNLLLGRQFKPKQNWEAHHIICSRHRSHSSNRFLLFNAIIKENTYSTVDISDLPEKMKYGINDPDNGCWLPPKNDDAKGTMYKKAVGHRYLHTVAYAKWINDKIRGVPDLQTLRGRLLMIRSQLQSMKIEVAKKVLTKNGKNDIYPEPNKKKI